MKKELLWGLPILGLASWVLGYPFMQRHSHKQIQKHPELKNKDIQTTKQACQKLKEFPTTMMNFVEGTRFTEEKHRRQASPYLHLLKPKSGGAATVIHELRDRLHGIINVTIAYSIPKMSFWKYFRGDPCQIIIRYELLPVTADLIGNYYEDREFRKYFQQWVNSLWQRKDLLLDEFK